MKDARASGTGESPTDQQPPEPMAASAARRAAGRLSVVATPIGNPADFSPRGVAALQDATVLCAEDTRVGRQLVADHCSRGKAPRVVRCDEHTAPFLSERLVEAIRAGEHVALVSDAGTPGIADPGQEVVAAVLRAGLRVTPIPGPSSLAAAVSASGLVRGAFAFQGFLPRSGSTRRAALAALRVERRPVVFLEAARRVPALLADLHAALAGVGTSARAVFLGRELTKRHEECLLFGSTGEASQWAEGRTLRGECVVVLGMETAAAAPEPVDSTALAPPGGEGSGSAISEEDAVGTAVELVRTHGMRPTEAVRRLWAVCRPLLAVERQRILAAVLVATAETGPRAGDRHQ